MARAAAAGEPLELGGGRTDGGRGEVGDEGIEAPLVGRGLEMLVEGSNGSSGAGFRSDGACALHRMQIALSLKLWHEGHSQLSS
jgi:hypothetical protein